MRITRIVDGPRGYKGRSIVAAHKGLHLSRAKFNTVVEDFHAVMEQSGISF